MVVLQNRTLITGGFPRTCSAVSVRENNVYEQLRISQVVPHSYQWIRHPSTYRDRELSKTPGSYHFGETE